ncbi:hypothetical protein AB0L00_04950 [Actinoallomurus sp. NPDC052308]|uniref:esterase/lipase family protein n=1 Tax=Actinoallomurus sp. NPDC052308 TaxID=3155530 RepID=UPI0034243623
MTPTDLIVVLPGIMGSALRRHGKLVWAPSAGTAIRAICTLGRSLTDLRLPEGVGDDHPGDDVEPAGLMPDLHVLPGIWTPVKGYDVLLKRLRSLGYRETLTHPGATPGNLLPVGYDWRLSNRYNGARLGTIVEPALQRWRAQGSQYADAQLIFVCHSMGGLVARWYIEHCGGADITRKLITLGTPYRGAPKALEQLVNGVSKAFGPLSTHLTDFATSLPALHQLLPEYACIEHHGTLAKIAEVHPPGLNRQMTRDAALFHTQLRDAETNRPDSLNSTHAIVGMQQSTTSTVRLADGLVVPLDTYQGDNLFGDATVPIVGACRPDVPMDSNTLRRIPDKHGNLHRNRAALDELEGVLTARNIHIRAPDTIHARVHVPEFALAGQPLPIEATLSNNHQVACRITVTNETGQLIQARVITPPHRTFIEGLPPGAYTIDFNGLNPTPPISPVSSTTLIWDPTITT